MEKEINIFWFRRDLRLSDNAGLYHSLRGGKKVMPIFIFDTEILGKLEDKQDARVGFIHQEVQRLKKELEGFGSSVLVRVGKPLEIFESLFNEYRVISVYANRDYEPYALERDAAVEKLCAERGKGFLTFKDQVIFEKDEVVKPDGKPYTVYTPYKNKAREKLNSFYLKAYPTEKYFGQLAAFSTKMPGLGEIGFGKSEIGFPSRDVEDALIQNYHLDRDFPAKDATTRLGIHLRFGTISIRQLAKRALGLNEVFLNELIWREFFMMILYHFPHSASYSFKRQYDNIKWRNNENEFEAWCNGKTGYPIVDAGMRQLNETGFLHNRIRMVVASFLCKHLLIDWRWGERYFASRLLDYELSANVGNWQWAAGSGCDAAPYFRVFNPELQTQKFDPDLKYIKRWVKELGAPNYPRPIVEHKFARERALKVYKEAVGSV
jgi:deoxyribodipyrimidine photo-lyase